MWPRETRGPAAGTPSGSACAAMAARGDLLRELGDGKREHTL